MAERTISADDTDCIRTDWRIQAANAPISVPSTKEIKVVVTMRPTVHGSAAPIRVLTFAG